MSKNFRNILNRFEIQNLTLYITTLMVFVALYTMISRNPIGIIGPTTLANGEWWNIILFPFAMDGSPIFQFLQAYLFWIFGSSLESSMGHSRYTQYILLGIVSVTLLALIFPGAVASVYIYYSVFFAIAYLSPNMEISLLFLPISFKIKWFAYLMIAIIFIPAMMSAILTLSPIPLVGPVASFLNFILFFGLSYLKNKNREHSANARRKKFVSSVPDHIHKCTICGITEKDDPHMEFRYCNECSDHEYCMVHLKDHTHIKE